MVLDVLDRQGHDRAALHLDDTGDGVRLIISSEAAAIGLLARFVPALAQALRAHRTADPPAGFRLRLANLRLREKLHDQSIRDPLTGLYNRRFLEATLEQELHRSGRHHTGLGRPRGDQHDGVGSRARLRVPAGRRRGRRRRFRGRQSGDGNDARDSVG